jgi:hypothetical protein
MGTMESKLQNEPVVRSLRITPFSNGTSLTKRHQGMLPRNQSSSVGCRFKKLRATHKRDYRTRQWGTCFALPTCPDIETIGFSGTR